MFGEVVEGGYVGLVVFGVVKFHYFAGDGGFQRAIVIWIDTDEYQIK